MAERAVWVFLSLVVALGCDDAPEAPARDEEIRTEVGTEGEIVDPPFEVEGDCEGLLLVWFDEEGPHTADTRDEIPEAHRERVRVDSLRLPPERRLDPSFVYLADLRNAGRDGAYEVRKVPREAFEDLIDRAGGVEVAAAAGAQVHGAGDPDADVIIYGADWCGACRSAAQFFRARGVAFVEKDIERDPGAQAEMQAKCRRAGISPSGIPIIDFRGTILAGFDPSRLDPLIRGQGAPI